MNKMKTNEYYCKQQIDCSKCFFYDKGCQILNNQLSQSEKKWIESVVNTKELKAEKSFIINQMILFILAFAKRKKTLANIHSKDIENYCLAGEDNYLIDCLWLCIQYGEITPARILSNYIYTKYGQYIYKISNSLSDHNNCPPDEILQRVYLAFTDKQYKSLTNFKGENVQFKTYLTKITKYKISECIKKFKTDDIPSDTLQNEEIEISPDQILFQKELIQFLETILIEAIDSIPLKRIMDVHIMLLRMKGKSFQFIANKLGIEKSNTVSRRYGRSKEKLINYVKQQLRYKYQTEIYDFDPEDIYLSIKQILEKKLVKINQVDKKTNCHINVRKKPVESSPEKFKIDTLIQEMKSKEI